MDEEGNAGFELTTDQLQNLTNKAFIWVDAEDDEEVRPPATPSVWPCFEWVLSSPAKHFPFAFARAPRTGKGLLPAL